RVEANAREVGSRNTARTIAKTAKAGRAGICPRAPVRLIMRSQRAPVRPLKSASKLVAVSRKSQNSTRQTRRSSKYQVTRSKCGNPSGNNPCVDRLLAGACLSQTVRGSERPPRDGLRLE